MSDADENIFGHPAADRRTIERADDAWVAAQRESLDARFLAVSELRCLVDATPSLVLLPHEALPPGWTAWPTIFLGMIDDAPVFALAVPETQAPHFHRHGEFADLRRIGLVVSPEQAALAAHARAVLHWHGLNRYCGACGSEMTVSAGGHARHCSRSECTVTQVFPRIDPAIIVLVTHEERCLLGRQAAWPQRRYSCLAGFVEAGETLEQAVRREVHEESGVGVEQVDYHSSQPWPFPQSLMIGFHASASEPAITLHDDELEDARWFSRTDIRNGLESGDLQLAAPLSIAYRLIRDWYAKNADPALLDRYAEAR